MKKNLGRLLLLLGVVVVLPILIIALLLATLDVNALKTALSAQASKALGRPVAMNGAVHMDFDNGIGVSVADVVVDNPEGFASKEFAKIGQLKLALSWRALLEHHIEIHSITLRDAELTLITNGAGQHNWEISQGDGATAPVSTGADKTATPENPGNANFKITRIEVAALNLEHTVLRQQDEATGKSQTLMLESAQIAAPYDGAFSLNAKGDYNQMLFSVNLDVAKGWRSLMLANGSSPISLHAAAYGQEVTVKTDLVRVDKTIRLDALQLEAKGLTVTGALAVDMATAIPTLSGSLTVPELNLLQLQAAKPATTAHLQASRPLARLIAATAPAPPDLSFLNKVQGDIALNIGKLVFAENKTLDSITTHLVIQNGGISLTPLKASFMGTVYTGSLYADSNLTHVILNGSNIDFPAVAKAFGTAAPIAAHGDIALNVTGHGFTADGFIRSLNGTVQVVVDSGTFDFGNNGQTAGSLIEVLFPQASGASGQRLTCAAARFNAENGVLHSNGLVLDSNFATVAGNGDIDLANRQVDMVLRHVPKGATKPNLLNLVPLQARGSFNHVVILPQTDNVLQNAAALIGNVSQTPQSTGVPQIDATRKDINPCLAAVQNPTMIMQAPASGNEAIQNTVDSAKQLYQGLRNQLKGSNGSNGKINPGALLKGLFGN